MLTKLAMKLGRAMGVRAALRWVRDVAAGEKGEGLQKAYWNLVGIKSGIGFGLAALAGALALLNADGLASIHPSVIGFVAGLGGFLFEAGILDKAWRNYRPRAFAESDLYRFLAQHPAEVASAFGAAFLWQANDCTFGPGWCGAALWVLALLAGAAIQVGLLDAAWRAPRPLRLREFK